MTGTAGATAYLRTGDDSLERYQMSAGQLLGGMRPTQAPTAVTPEAIDSSCSHSCLEKRKK